MPYRTKKYRVPHTIPCHTLPYHTVSIPCHTIPHHNVPYPYPTRSHRTTAYQNIPYHIPITHTIPYHTLPKNIVPYTRPYRHSLFAVVYSIPNHLSPERVEERAVVQALLHAKGGVTTACSRFDSSRHHGCQHMFVYLRKPMVLPVAQTAAYRSRSHRERLGRNTRRQMKR